MSQTSISEKQWHEIDPRGIEPASRPASGDDSGDAVKSLYDLARSKALAAFDTAAAELDLAFGEYQRRCRDARQSYRSAIAHLAPGDRSAPEATREDALAGARFAFNSALIKIGAAHAATFNPVPRLAPSGARKT